MERTVAVLAARDGSPHRGGHAAARRARGLAALVGWSHAEPQETLWPEACADRIVDLFLAPDVGRFTLVADAGGFEGGVRLDLGLAQMALEGLRRLDEWPELDRRYPNDAAALVAGGGAASRARPGSARCSRPPAVAPRSRRRASRSAFRAPRCSGASRRSASSASRAWRVSANADPVASLVEKAQLLVDARQFDEAAIVLRSLLAADPSDRRVRDLLREAEREHVAALYAELSPVAIPVLVAGPASLDGPAARRLAPNDREVAGRLNGAWDVASVTLASPLREVETLKVLGSSSGSDS